MVSIVNYNNKVNINIFDNKYDALLLVANQLTYLNREGHKNIAISGGSSPIQLFEIMRDEYSKEDFNNINFFWVDERCVAIESEESNYGNFKRILIDSKIIKENQVFPLYLTNNIEKNIENVESQIRDNVEFKNELPKFDLVILGLGDDGHTASLFPDNLKALSSNEIIIKTENPYSKQERLTLTKNVLNNSKLIYFLVFSKSKADIVYQVLSKHFADLPASYIKNDDSVYWFLDKDAVSKLDM